MASQSLYRKWRSQTFGDLVGQEPVIRTLRNALSSGNLAHAYLFTGPRGTGKTSTARLLAKTINCLQPQEGEPCNACAQCQEITVGSSFNVIEIDAASNRGIDSIRELREKVMVPPVNGKYKVYILDEAHMLTTEAFNALLKTLEEPPPHAIFVMATTDVHKMLPTVLSRCQRFDFKRFSARQIVDRLRFIAEQEQVKLESGAAELIARAAAGGMRDALSLLDQAIAYAGREISLSQVQIMLGVADPRAIEKFVGHIANLDSSAGLHLIHDLAESGADLRQLNAQVAEYCRAMMLTSAGANIAEILDLTTDEISEIVQMAQRFTLEELTEFARIFAQNELVQKSQGTPQLGLELAQLACIEMHRRRQSGQSVSVSPPVPPTMPVPVARPNQFPMQQERVHSSGIVETAASSPHREARPLSYEQDAPKGVSQSQSQLAINGAARDRSASVPQTEPVAAQIQALQSIALDTNIVTESDAPPLSIEKIREQWEYIKRRVKSKKDGAKIAALLNGCVIVGVEGTNELVIILRANADFFYNTLHQNAAHHAAIEWAMKIELQQECKLRLLPPGQSLSKQVTIPPPAPHEPEPKNFLSTSTLARPSQRSAYREPSVFAPEMLPVPPTKTQGQSPPKTGQAQPPQQNPLASAPSSVTAVGVLHPSHLTMTKDVRENIMTVSSVEGENRQQTAAKQAKSDQVVKEVIRMFKAEIKNIQLK